MQDVKLFRKDVGNGNLFIFICYPWVTNLLPVYDAAVFINLTLIQYELRARQILIRGRVVFILFFDGDAAGNPAAGCHSAGRITALYRI